MSQVGWHPDPWGEGVLRYYDGGSWTAHTRAVAPSAQLTQVTHVIGAPKKSVGVALLLTFLFGPFGMFYSTIAGGVVMLVVGFVIGPIVGALTMGVGLVIWLPLTWAIQLVWAGVAASNSSPSSTMQVASVAQFHQPVHLSAAIPSAPIYPQHSLPPATAVPSTVTPVPNSGTPAETSPAVAEWWNTPFDIAPDIVDAEIIDSFPTHPSP